jgi:predicted metal-dependent hydrolase
MFKSSANHTIDDIEFTVKYSGRRTLGISILPDSTVVVRVPYFTSFKTINRIVKEKSVWITKHRENYRIHDSIKPGRSFADGEKHLFRGIENILKTEKSAKSYIRFNNGTIELGLVKPDDAEAVKRLLYKGYKNEAMNLFPVMLSEILTRFENQRFRPTGLVIRSMKRRWGSCSNKGKITLSTELIKLPDLYIEYVIIHELCHLKHHNHGAGYYKLLSELFPEWKPVRKELRKYIR